jgi:glyoxylate reductase
VRSALEAAYELVEEPVEVDGILSLLTTKVDRELLERAGPRLAIVANYAVGVDNIDLAETRARGVVVANTPDVLTRATAELAVGLMLSLMRRISEGDRLIRGRRPWQFGLEFMLGESLEGKLVGIVGAGRIGRETARLVGAFGAQVELLGRAEPLAPLLAKADVVSLHCPLSERTYHLIDEPALRSMKPTAVLINTARGGVVDELALARALREGWIAGAALDVHEHEPQVAEEFLAFENVVLAPHLGSATSATRRAMGELVLEALRAVLLDGRLPANVVE